MRFLKNTATAAKTTMMTTAAIPTYIRVAGLSVGGGGCVGCGLKVGVTVGGGTVVEGGGVTVGNTEGAAAATTDTYVVSNELA